MRVAVTLLTVLAIASVIGTVLKQGEPYADYLAQFGPFWFPLFAEWGFYDVYHSSWFLGILGFLIFSTSLCLYRHTPLFLREAYSFREKVREASLRAIPNSLALITDLPMGPRLDKLRALLQAAGYKLRIISRENSVLLAAKTGSFQRFGYVFTHAGIVIICMGGLLDGNLPLLWQKTWGGLIPETRDIPASQVPVQSRLPQTNLSFRGNVSIPEGSKADLAFINAGEGYFVQELPFSIGVDRFQIEHYPTGQPKSFATSLTVQDKATGELVSGVVKVNHPLTVRGVSIYQASFGDGGSKLALNGWSLAKNELLQSMKPIPLAGEVLSKQAITLAGAEYTLEWIDFRLFNIESTDTRGEQSTKKKIGGAAVNSSSNTHLKNVGPSFVYRLRDAQGQAKEYQNYMYPIILEGRPYYLSGVRENPSDSYRYLRIPQAPPSLTTETADSSSSNLQSSGLLPYFVWRNFILDSSRHRAIAERFAQNASYHGGLAEKSYPKLVESTQQALKFFTEHGLEGLAQFLQDKVPEAEQESVAQAYLKILDGAGLAALELSQERLGRPIRDKTDPTVQWFMRDAINSLSDGFYYDAPLWLELTSFQQIQATGLQMTRSPGKFWVYTGSLILVGGIFLMLYLHQRRVWLLLKPHETLFAFACNRKNIETAKELDILRQSIQKLHTSSVDSP